MNLQPIGDKVLIRPDAKATKHGSLFLPENGEYRPRYGTVLAVGPGAWSHESLIIPAGTAVLKNYTITENVGFRSLSGENCVLSDDVIADRMIRVPMSVKVGDRVAFSQYGTDGIETVDGEEVLIIKEERILAVEKPLTAVDCEGAANHPTFSAGTLSREDKAAIEREQMREERRAYIERRGPSMIDRKPDEGV